MKYPVIRKFRDKYTKILYKAGSIYETDDIKRAKYLQNKNVLGGEAETSKPKIHTELKDEVGTNEEENEIQDEDENRLGLERETELQQEIQRIKHVGGGWYELPDGTRVKGKEAAEIAGGDSE